MKRIETEIETGIGTAIGTETGTDGTRTGTGTEIANEIVKGHEIGGTDGTEACLRVATETATETDGIDREAAVEAEAVESWGWAF